MKEQGEVVRQTEQALCLLPIPNHAGVDVAVVLIDQRWFKAKQEATNVFTMHTHHSLMMDLHPLETQGWHSVVAWCPADYAVLHPPGSRSFQGSLLPALSVLS